MAQTLVEGSPAGDDGADRLGVPPTDSGSENGLLEEVVHLDDLATAVVSALSANAVRDLGLAAVVASRRSGVV